MTHEQLVEEITFKDDGYRITAFKGGIELGVVTEYKHAEYGNLFTKYISSLLTTTAQRVREETIEEMVNAVKKCPKHKSGFLHPQDVLSTLNK